VAGRQLDEATWLAELRRLAEASQAQADEGWTAAELAVLFGHSTKWVLKMLTPAVREGRVRVGRRAGVSIDGRRVVSPVYTLIGKPASGSGTTKPRRGAGSSGG
jgi:hypothetical protein